MIVKYIVMECHKGYAVLMDEDSVFVNAANLGYEVGQTVTDPVLMENESHTVKRRNRIVMSLAAAAACLAITCGVGYHYYSVNYKTHSTVIISSNAGVKMYLNKKDKVIKLESISPEGESILSEYSGKGKDLNSAINDIVGIGISKGYISDGDTVEVFVPENESDNSRKEIEDDLAGLSVKADIQPIDNYAAKTATEPTVPTAPEPPKPPEGDKPEPPHHGDNVAVPTAPEPPSEPADHKPPEPPQPPTGKDGLKPEPPSAPLPPDGEAHHEGLAVKPPEAPDPPDAKLPHEILHSPNEQTACIPELPEKTAPEILHKSSLEKRP